MRREREVLLGRALLRQGKQPRHFLYPYNVVHKTAAIRLQCMCADNERAGLLNVAHESNSIRLLRRIIRQPEYNLAPNGVQAGAFLLLAEPYASLKDDAVFPHQLLLRAGLLGRVRNVVKESAKSFCHERLIIEAWRISRKEYDYS